MQHLYMQAMTVSLGQKKAAVFASLCLSTSNLHHGHEAIDGFDGVAERLGMFMSIQILKWNLSLSVNSR